MSIDYCMCLPYFQLGNRLCKETDFMEKMKDYIWSSNLEIAEFEHGWDAVIKEFKLDGNKWLSDMYDLRASWIPVFFRDQPMFGLMRTTSRSESEIFSWGNFINKVILYVNFGCVFQVQWIGRGMKLLGWTMSQILVFLLQCLDGLLKMMQLKFLRVLFFINSKKK